MSIIRLSFNSDVDYLTCGTNSGYLIYALAPNITKKISKEKNGGIGIVNMLKKSNILALVGGGDNPFRSKNTLIIFDQGKDKELKQINFTSQIKNILLDHNKRICVILETEINIIELDRVDEHIERSTYRNSKGLVDMTNIKQNNGSYKTIIVTLGKEKGDVFIWRLDDKENNKFYIKAHESNIDALTISKDGSLVATTSEMATLIRVFSTVTGEKLYEFRRGSATSGGIHDLAISKDNRTLACCSGSGTVHVFDMYLDKEKSINSKSMVSYLGSFISNYFESEWSFKQHYLQTSDKMICEFDGDDVLHVATYGGKYYKIFSGIDSKTDKTGEIYRYNMIKYDDLYVNS